MILNRLHHHNKPIIIHSPCLRTFERGHFDRREPIDALILETMPPQVHQSCRPILTPFVRFSPPASPENHKYLKEAKNRTMNFPVRKVLPLLVFVLSSLSVLRLLRISVKSSSSSFRGLSTMTLRPTCSSSLPACDTVESNPQIKNSASPSILAEKEIKLLADVITRKSPCNVLFFGFEPQYIFLSSINTRGSTVILEDEPEKITSAPEVNPNNTRIYNVRYHQMEAKNAYTLLRRARDNPACAPNVNVLQDSGCKLELRDLPWEVYNIRWDVIVVDGPRGDELEAPGRMGTIYTAAMLARKGSHTTDVFVHDVHRTVEKWFSWEFLCQENLVSTIGKLWRFRIKGQSNTSRFCLPDTVLIQ